MLTPEFWHYVAIGLTVAVGAIGGGIGQGLGAVGTLDAIVRQPHVEEKAFRSMIIGLAFVESGVVLVLLVALLMLFATGYKITMPIAIAELGMALAISVSSTVKGIASSTATTASCIAISRQPFLGQKILTFMLLIQSVMETPIIFAFVIVLFIRGSLHDSITYLEGIKYFAAALCITLGSIGPSIGRSVFSKSSFDALGLNQEAYNKIFMFSIINQVVLETPMIFSLLVSMLIFYFPLSPVSPTSTVICFLVAAFAMGVGGSGASCANGSVASKSVTQIALRPEYYMALFRSTILTQAFIESCAIYALVVSLILLTKQF